MLFPTANSSKEISPKKSTKTQGWGESPRHFKVQDTEESFKSHIKWWCKTQTHCTKVSCFSPIPLQPIHRQRAPEQPLLLVRWPEGQVSQGRTGGSALPPEASWAGLSSTSRSVPSWLGRSHHGHCVPSGFGQHLGLFGQRSQPLPVQSYARGWSFPWRCWGPKWVDATKWSLRGKYNDCVFSFPFVIHPSPSCVLYCQSQSLKSLSTNDDDAPTANVSFQILLLNILLPSPYCQSNPICGSGRWFAHYIMLYCCI